MRGHCSARDQIDTGSVRAALEGPAWALHSIVGWVLPVFSDLFCVKKTITKASLSSNVLGYRFFDYYDKTCCTLASRHNS